MKNIREIHGRRSVGGDTWGMYEATQLGIWGTSATGSVYSTTTQTKEY